MNDTTMQGGRNIAMKVPPHLLDDTVSFYRDVVGLEQVRELAPEIVFRFGANRLWIDKVDGLSQAEIWLELRTDDIASAASQFEAAGVARRDEIEALPEGFEGFWISNRAGIIHLVAKDRSPPASPER